MDDMWDDVWTLEEVEGGELHVKETCWFLCFAVPCQLTWSWSSVAPVASVPMCGLDLPLFILKKTSRASTSVSAFLNVVPEDSGGVCV